jgi:hypothetical protein
MHLKRLALRSLLFIALIGGLSVCGIDTSAPVSSPPRLDSGSGSSGDGGSDDDNSGSNSGSGSGNGTLLSCNTAGYDRVTNTIGSDGGTIDIGPHRLTVPAGALRENVRITAKAPAGGHILVELQPHGLNFRKDAYLRLSFAECPPEVDSARVAYVGDDLDIYYFLPSVTDSTARTSTGRLDHFSGYSLAE